MSSLDLRTAADHDLHGRARYLFWPTILLSLLLIAELGYSNQWRIIGLLAHFGFLLGVALVAARQAEVDLPKFCLALLVVPVSRLIQVGTALEVVGSFVKEAVINVALLVAAIQVMRLQGLTLDDVLIRAGGRLRLGGPLIAIGALALGGVGAWLSGARLTFDVLGAPPALIAGGVVLACAGAFIECLVFMGLLLPATQRLLGPWLGVPYVAVIWAMRFGFMPWTYMGAMLIEGLILAWLTTRTQSMLYAVLAHWLIIVAFFATAGVLG